MYGLLIVVFCIFCSSCNDGTQTHHRSYVISKSHQASADSDSVEKVNETPPD